MAYLTLEQNFDHALLVVSMKEKPGDPSHEQEDPTVCWSGGRIVAQHLAEDAVDKIKYRRKISRNPPQIDAMTMKRIEKWIKDCYK